MFKKWLQVLQLKLIKLINFKKETKIDMACIDCDNSTITDIPSGPPGPTGPQGPIGNNGINAFTTLTGSSTSLGSNQYTVNMINVSWLAIGEVIYIQGAGYYQVISFDPSANIATILNLLYPGNTTSFTANSKVSPGGLIGATGSTGATGATGATGPQGPQGTGATDLQNYKSTSTAITAPTDFLVNPVLTGTGGYIVASVVVYLKSTTELTATVTPILDITVISSERMVITGPTNIGGVSNFAIPMVFKIPYTPGNAFNIHVVLDNYSYSTTCIVTVNYNYQRT